MNVQAHLSELEKRHQAIERELDDAKTHPSVDDLTITELKRKKLQLKDEIERLRDASESEALHIARNASRRCPWRGGFRLSVFRFSGFRLRDGRVTFLFAHALARPHTRSHALGQVA